MKNSRKAGKIMNLSVQAWQFKANSSQAVKVVQVCDRPQVRKKPPHPHKKKKSFYLEVADSLLTSCMKSGVQKISVLYECRYLRWIPSPPASMEGGSLEYSMFRAGE